MSVDEGLYAWLEEALEPIGRLSLRRMMGGATLYLDGNDRVSIAPHCSVQSGGLDGPIIFGIMVDGELWLKSDAEADPIWDAVSTERFTVTFKDGTIDRMNYRRAPSDVYDDADELQRWVSVSLEAGRRRVVKKRPQRRAAANAARSPGSPRSS
jgi:DNA transformation protein